VSATIAGDRVVGLAVAGPQAPDGRRDLLALGVAPDHRGAGIATRLLIDSPADRAEITLAERDPIEPMDVGVRGRIAASLLTRGGFSVGRGGGPVDAADPSALVGIRDGGSGR
jgi:GNAT superfamily N-acetyltransferase